jgi:ERCC4-related helicase
MTVCAEVTRRFRVLALSATPGSNKQSIQEVIGNLKIATIECRLEDDPEIAKHTHARQVCYTMYKCMQ